MTLFQEGLRAWAHQIESGLFLIDGKRLPEDSELTAGQVVNDTHMRAEPHFGAFLKGQIRIFCIL